MTAKVTEGARHRQSMHDKPPHPRSVPIIVPEQDADAAPDQPFAEGARDMLDADLRHRMISETAYHRYAERTYADGYDLDDWLQAEAEVDHLLLGRPAGDGRV